MTVLTVSSYCIVIFRFFLDYGGHAMHIFKDVIAYFQADPGRIFGWPFFFLAVGLNVWSSMTLFAAGALPGKKKRSRAGPQDQGGNAKRYAVQCLAIRHQRAAGKSRTTRYRFL
jgi:hypothetical protein